MQWVFSQWYIRKQLLGLQNKQPIKVALLGLSKWLDFQTSPDASSELYLLQFQVEPEFITNCPQLLHLLEFLVLLVTQDQHLLSQCSLPFSAHACPPKTIYISFPASRDKKHQLSSASHQIVKLGIVFAVAQSLSQV